MRCRSPAAAPQCRSRCRFAREGDDAVAAAGVAVQVQVAVVEDAATWIVPEFPRPAVRRRFRSGTGFEPSSNGEYQAIQAVGRMIAENLEYVDLKQDVQDRNDPGTQQRMQHMIASPGSNCWYLSDYG